MKKSIVLGFLLFFILPQMVSASVVIKINQGSNPAQTEYAIFEQERGLYVQGNGTLEQEEFWQDFSAWGGVDGFEILDLEDDAIFTFQIKARNVTSDETEFSDPISIQNERGPRDLPENFFTKRSAVNSVDKSIFTMAMTGKENSGVSKTALGAGTNAFLITLSVFFIGFLGQFFFYLSKKESHVPSYVVTRIKRLGVIILLVFGFQMVFTSLVPTSFASWSPPESEMFSADAVLVKSGDVLTYQMALSNNETQRNEVEVTDIIPEGTTYIEGSLAYESELQTDIMDDDFGYYDSINNQVIFSIPVIEANATENVYFSVIVQ